MACAPNPHQNLYRRIFLFTSLSFRFFHITAIIVTFSYQALGRPKKPHIIFIVADDLGWDDVSFHGSPQIPTKNIDHLANNGVILNNYYVSPICTPTRASIMTGKYPVHLGMQHFVIYAAQPYGLPLDEITLPQYLKTQGYRTAGVGKWHLGFFAKEYTPVHRGFDSFYGFWSAKTDYWNHSSYENEFWGIDMRDNMEPISTKNGVYGTDLFTQKAVQVIQDHEKDKPLFLYLAHQAVHSANEYDPLQAPQSTIDKFKDTIDEVERRKYAAMVTALDESVGKVFDALKDKKMENDTVIIFTSDNGGAPHGFNWNMGSNYPFRGGKDMIWEGGVRGTAFVYSDFIAKKGRVSSALIDVSDWVPTLYHLAGGNPDLLHPNIDGMNVWEAISEDQRSPRHEVLHAIDPWRKFAAIRQGRFKLVVGMDDTYQEDWHPRYSGKDLNTMEQPNVLPGAVIECGLKFNNSRKCDSKNGSACLFDIEDDPCEYNDILKELSHVVDRLKKRLNEFRNSSRPVWYPGIDKGANPAKFDGYWAPWKELSDNSSVINAWNSVSTLLVMDLLGAGKTCNLSSTELLSDEMILPYVQPDTVKPSQFDEIAANYTDFDCNIDTNLTWTPNKPVTIHKSEQPQNQSDRFYYRFENID